MIRDELPDDRRAIRSVNEAAFGRPGEANLVDNLRDEGDIALSLITIEGGRIVEHVLFSRLGAPFLAWGLGPVAVAPDGLRIGIGSRLIQTVLDRARGAGVTGVFVLGAPAYYTRFGFDPVLARGFFSPYAGPYLMALALDGTLPANEGSVAYAPAFGRLA